MKLESTPLVGKPYRHFKRYREIISVFFRYGFDEVIYGLGLNRFLDPVLRRRKSAVDFEKTRPERFRLALQDLGSSFIKFGQILASRPDLLPQEYLDELHALEDDVPQLSFEHIKQVVEEDLQRPLDEVFLSFSEKPLAAASIAQIHEAVLHTGESVVVKVQRPKLKAQFEVDLEIVRNLASMAETHLDTWKVHRPTRLVDQIRRMLMRELDFNIELAYIDRFRHHFGADPNIVIPQTWDEFCSTRVLVMEKINGIKSSALDILVEKGYDRKKIAHRAAHSVMEQIFEHGFFHADPHAGNIFVLPEEKVCFLDFGMMGSMNRDLRENFAELLHGIANRDEHMAANALIELTNPDSRPDRRSLEIDVSEFMTQHFYRPLRQMRIGRLLTELVQQTTRHGLSIPTELFILIKCVATMENVVRQLDPDFDLVKEAVPHIRKVRTDRLRPGRIIETVRETGGSLFTLFRYLPLEINNFFRSLEKGRARIAFEHHGLKPMIRTLDQVSNRISLAIVLASLIVGSSLIIHAGIPPLWNNIPAIGLLGYTFAGVIGAWLVYSIFRHGNL
ncbi:MAG: hypothetical protein JJT75_05315 [Opitutales bacterium]|nr:hypothetical protein [Opitutales bacterium]MCH8541680.1 hypothetical protein [Opitutales bacterium]